MQVRKQVDVGPSSFRPEPDTPGASRFREASMTKLGDSKVNCPQKNKTAACRRTDSLDPAGINHT